MIGAATVMFSVVYNVLVSGMSGVSPTDPVTFVVMAAVVVTVGLAACLLPARQASRVDPLLALRSE